MLKMRYLSHMDGLHIKQNVLSVHHISAQKNYKQTPYAYCINLLQPVKLLFTSRSVMFHTCSEH